MSAVFHPQRDNLPTRGYSYDLSFFYVIDLHNTKLKKKKNEYTIGPYLRFVFTQARET